jgi:serine/threonine protein kinase
MKREMGTWSRLEHPNIAALRGYNIENAYGMLSISLVLDWYPHGNISEFLTNYPHANRKRLVS